MKKRAFTLLELLVVIAIIGTLLAFSLPSVRRVREGARRAICANNLRQHGIAWHLYLDEHEELFPAWGNTPKDGKTKYFTFGGKQGSHYAGNDDYGAKHRVLNPYLEIYNETSPNVDVFHCPSDSKPPPFLNGTFFDRVGNSYHCSRWLLSMIPGYKSRLLATVTSTHSKVCLEYCNPENFPGHGGKHFVWGPDADFEEFDVPLIVLFVDGHVAGPFIPKNDCELCDPNTDKKILLAPAGCGP